MNREIRFRAWDSHNKVMITPFCELIDNRFWGEDCTNTGYAPSHIMQFTGLKDKNGKDIYEGDIIETSYGKVGTVVYYERSASFIVNDPSHFNEQLWHDAVNSEVIGNIYEQKELVK